MNTVRDTLALLSPPPLSIHTSLISQSITVEHSPELSVGVIKDALDGAGFDLVMTPDAEEYHLERSKLTSPSDWLSRKRQKHAEQCLLCKEEEHTNGGEPTSSDSVSTRRLQLCSIKFFSLTCSFSLAEKTAPQGPYNAAFTLGGVTCSSCATNITQAIEPIQGVREVFVDVVGKTATMTVDEPHIVDVVRKAIEDSGYECELVNLDILVRLKQRPTANAIPLAEPQKLGSEPRKQDGPFKALFSVDGMTCASCVSNVTHALEELSGVSEVAVNLIGKSASATLKSEDLTTSLISALEDAGYDAELIKIEPVFPDKQPQKPRKSPKVSQREQGPFVASFSIGGMTCASCVSHVTEATSELEGVSDVAVNLVGKSATAILKTRELVPAFIEAVEDGGYEAELISVEPVAGASDESEEDEIVSRSVALRVDGMFCA